MTRYFRQTNGKWCGWYETQANGKKLIITAEGKSEIHAKTMLKKRLKKLGINHE